MRTVKATEAVGPLVEIIASIGVGLALWYVYAANLSAGRFFGLITGIFIIYEPIKTLSKLHIVMQRSLGATTQIFAILDSVPTVRDAPNAIELASSRGEIKLENVTFRYPTGVTTAISDIDLHIEPGKTYALVGASGAGKSTILSLILRLYDPTVGAVKIDGSDLRSLTQKSLREQIGLVSQETFLFHDTIFKNIQFGRLSATAEEVYAAAKTASAHEFILAQPDGYDTVIGDKGCLISGGQQQRLAIARTKSLCSKVAASRKSELTPSFSKNRATIVASMICNSINRPTSLQNPPPSRTCSLKNLSNFPPARI